MSATIVQATTIGDNTAQSPSAAMSLTCSAGHAVILLATLVTKTRTISSVTDSASNSGWVHVVGGGGSTSGYCDIWWNPSLPSSITTVTLHYSGTTKCNVGVLEVTGLTGVADTGASTTNHTTATTAPAESITTANAADFIVAGCGATTIPTAVASPFTLSAGASAAGPGAGIHVATGTVSETSTGTYTATFTTISETSTTAIAGFKVAATLVSGTAASTVTFTGAAAGTATHHLTSGTAASSVAFTGAAAGTATHHHYSGTAASSVAFTPAATGKVTVKASAASSVAFTGTAAGSAGFHTVHNDFESGQTTGTTITTGNSGTGTNTAFDSVTGSPKYSTVQAHGGTLSAITNASAASHVNWSATTLGASPVAIYGRVYLWMDAVPTSGFVVMEASGDQHSNILRILTVAPTGVFKVVANDGTTSTQVQGTVAYALSQWIRIEWQLSFSGGSAQIAYQLFNTPESLTPDENVSTSRAVTDVLFNAIQIGPQSTPAPATVYFDDLALSNSATPGPSGNTLISGTAASAVTFTGAAAGTATHHVSSGTAASTVTFTGAASGTATHHVYSGTAAATVAFIGVGLGSDTHHVFNGTAASTVSFTGAAAGTATHHHYSGTAASAVSFTGLAAGTATHHHYSGTAASTVAFTGAASGAATNHAVVAWASTHHDLGTSITAAQTTDSNYAPAVRNNFTSVTPEYEMEWGQVEQSQGSFDFTNMDTIAAFAVANNLAVTGHTLIWHADGNTDLMPAWVTGGSWTRDTLLAVLENHITTVVGRYSSTVRSWNVANEAFNSDGTRVSWIFQSVIGDDWIEKAFQYAHAADPTAQLFYNDYSIDWGFFGGNDKYTAVLAMLTDFVARGIPIHGVGIQGHYDLQFTDYPDPTDLADVMQTYRALGLAVRITELDCRIDNVSGTTPAKQALQATVYSNAATALQNSGGLSLTVWGVSDATNWEGTTAAAAPFDVSYQPKPCWTGIKNFAKTHILTAAGTATHHHYAGTATGTVTFTGHATGTGSATAVAAATVTFTGLAAGAATHHHYAGTGASSVAFTGLAVGRVTVRGTAASTIAFLGLAAATDAHHVYTGVAASTITITGTATGTVTHHHYVGTAAGLVSFVGAAVGRSSGIITLDIALLWFYHETGLDPFPVRPGLTLNVHAMFSQRYRDLSVPFPTNEDPTVTVNLERLWNQKYEDTSVPFPLDRA